MAESKKKAKELLIDFKMLKKPLIPMDNQADEVAAGIIQYLCYHHPDILTLKLIGNPKNKRQRISRLSPAIAHLTYLRVLCLTHNQLRELPLQIDQMLRLRKLDLYGNQLQSFPIRLASWVRLFIVYNKHLELMHNPLLHPDSSIAVDLPTLNELLSQELPRSLVAICGKAVLNMLNLAPEGQRNQLIQRLPNELRRLSKLDQAYQGQLKDKRIVYFTSKLRIRLAETHERDPEDSQVSQLISEFYYLPFHWDQAIYTRQDIDTLLNCLKNSQVYLAPKQ